VEQEKDGWELVDMLWCEGAQNIGLSGYKFKSYDHNARPSQTDECNGNSATICCKALIDIKNRKLQGDTVY